MFIPLNNLPKKTENHADEQGNVRIKASHLILKYELVKQAFGEEQMYMLL